MGATVLPPSATSRRSGAVSSHACTSRSRIGINPACFAKPAAADAKKPKRPGSFRDGEPPAKRVRGVCAQGEPDAAAAPKIKKRPRPGSSPSSPRASAAAAVSVIKNLSSASQNRIPENAVPSRTSTSTSSLSELIAKARLAKARPDPDAAAEAVRLRDIQRRRAEARRELEMMVATVEFNDPFIDPSDVFK